MSSPHSLDSSRSSTRPADAVLNAALALDASRPRTENAQTLIDALVDGGWIGASAVWWASGDARQAPRLAVSGDIGALPSTLDRTSLPDIHSPLVLSPLSATATALPSALCSASGTDLIVPLQPNGLWWMHRTGRSFEDDDGRIVARLASKLTHCLSTAEAKPETPSPPIADAAGILLGDASAVPDDVPAEPFRVVESRFKALLDSMQAAVIVLDANHNITYANGSAWALFRTSPQKIGYRPDGTPIDDAVSLPDAFDQVRNRVENPDAFIDRLRDHLQHQIPVRGERVTFANGTVTERSYVPVRAQGETVGHLVVYRDVTDQHEARRALRESEERWRQLVESHPGPIYVTVDGCFEYVNPATVDLFGADTAEDLLGKDVVDFAHPEVRDDIRARRDQLTDERAPTEPFEHRTVRLDGEVRRVIVRSVPVTFRGQRAAQTMVRDVTEQREAEANLKELTRLYQALLDNMPADVALFDADGRLEYSTEIPAEGDTAREDVVGLTMPEISDRLFDDPDHLHRASEAIETVLRTGESVRYERPLSTADGPLRYFLRIFTPLLDDGQVQRVLAFGVDITDRKKAEKQVQEAKETAENALKAKEQFLSTMTHELRTPLHAVIGLTELLASTPLNDDQQEYLNDIRFSADSLLDLINDILDVSKMDAGKLTLRPKPFSPAELARQIIDTMQKRAASRGNQLTLTVDSALPDRLVGDPLRIKQILWNLVSNAIDATDNGSVDVRLAPADPPSASPDVPFDGPPVWIAFRVSDTGPGIPDADRDRVFESFVQIDRPGTEASSGTGLGLTIVRDLVELHGGTITLDTTVGDGSTFTARLPLAPPSRDAPAETTSPDAADRSGPEARTSSSLPSEAPAPGEEAPALDGLCLLIVEDTASNRTLTTHVLTAAGAEVDAVSRGDDALDRMRTTAYDCVVMDLQLPGIDGFETARRIRNDLGLTDLPILATSASSVASRYEEVTAAGMDAFLSKPFRPYEICRLVHDACYGDGAQAASAYPRLPKHTVPAPSSPRRSSSSADDDLTDDDFVDVNALTEHAQTYQVPVADLLDAFRRDARALASVLAAHREGDEIDADRVGTACHDLKTSAHLVGAFPLLSLLDDVESADTVDGETLAALRARLDATRTALRSVEAGAAE